MKKFLLVVLAFVMCLSLFACGASLSDKVSKESEKYISENYRLVMDGFASKPVNVDVASVLEMEVDKEWVVMGTYTIKIDHDIMSAKFAMIATYDEATKGFEFSNVEFDDFN